MQAFQVGPDAYYQKGIEWEITPGSILFNFH